MRSAPVFTSFSRMLSAMTDRPIYSAAQPRCFEQRQQRRCLALSEAGTCGDNISAQSPREAPDIFQIPHRKAGTLSGAFSDTALGTRHFSRSMDWRMPKPALRLRRAGRTLPARRRVRVAPLYVDLNLRRVRTTSPLLRWRQVQERTEHDRLCSCLPVIATLLRRTELEDQLQLEGLFGYGDHACSVVYHLIPGVWQPTLAAGR